jgi:hypothetical protein
MKPGPIVALVFVAIIGGVFYWRLYESAPGSPASAPAASTPAAAPAAPAPSVVAQAASVAPLPPVAPSEAIDAEGVPAALEGLVGKPALSAFRLDDFARRVVATVDNLARERASPALWPVVATPGRFTVRASDGATVIDPDNGLRYAPFVQMIERVDLRQAVGVYRRMLGLLQPAYEALGYPGKSFDERLLAVVDHLLAAPEPAGPVRVHLPVFNGPVQPARPWLLYEFDDPALERRSAGQKLLVRMGPVDERRVKQRLRVLRELLVAR